MVGPCALHPILSSTPQAAQGIQQGGCSVQPWQWLWYLRAISGNGKPVVDCCFFHCKVSLHCYEYLCFFYTSFKLTPSLLKILFAIPGFNLAVAVFLFNMISFGQTLSWRVLGVPLRCAVHTQVPVSAAVGVQALLPRTLWASHRSQRHTAYQSRARHRARTLKEERRKRDWESIWDMLPTSAKVLFQDLLLYIAADCFSVPFLKRRPWNLIANHCFESMIFFHWQFYDRVVLVITPHQNLLVWQICWSLLNKQ